MNKVNIGNSDFLYRRVSTKLIIFDEKIQKYRPMSGAFDNSRGTNEMSIDIGKLLNHPSDSLKKYPEYGLVSLIAQVVYEKGQQVEHQPLPDNYAHGSVIGKKTESIKDYFVEHCEFVINPKLIK